MKPNDLVSECGGDTETEFKPVMEAWMVFAIADFIQRSEDIGLEINDRQEIDVRQFPDGRIMIAFCQEDWTEGTAVEIKPVG